MKTVLLILLLSLSIFCFSQDKKKTFILHSKDSELVENKKIMNFYFDNKKLLFGHLKDKHKSKLVNYSAVKNHIIDIQKLKENINLKIKEVGIEQFYSKEYFDIKVFVPNSKCELEGMLYDVKEFVPILTEN